MHTVLPGVSLLFLIGSITGCGQSPQVSSSVDPPEASAGTTAPLSGVNRLRMRVDGIEWSADRDLFGAVHPPGMNSVVLMAGSLGPKDANEQSFNLNLFGIDAPGHYVVEHGNASGSVMQLANVSPERYLIGGLMFEYRFEVELVTMQANPVAIEARFKGVLQANDDHRVTISDGEFVYRE